MCNCRKPPVVRKTTNSNPIARAIKNNATSADSNSTVSRSRVGSLRFIRK